MCIFPIIQRFVANLLQTPSSEGFYFTWKVVNNWLFAISQDAKDHMSLPFNPKGKEHDNNKSTYIFISLMV